MTGPDRHPEPGELLALREGALDEDAAARALRHLLACVECRDACNDVARLDDLVIESGLPLATSVATPAATLAAMDAVITRHVGRSSSPPRRRLGLRAVGGILAAAAAGFVLWITLRPDSAQAGRLSGRVLFADAPGGLRGATTRTFHFELALDPRGRPGHVAVFRLHDGAVDVVYPHPNPVLGTFGRTAPLAPGESIRIPPTPLADYDAPPVGAAAPRFFVVILDAPPSAQSLTPVVAELGAARGDGDGIRKRLEERFGAVLDIR